MSKKTKKKFTRPATTHKATVSRQSRQKAKSILPWLIAAVLTTLVCFLPMLNNGFTNWDDEYYVVNNSMLRSPDWHAIFTQSVAANYHPLTMATLAANYQISGLHPFSYLLVNLVLHLMNVVLVFLFIYEISAKKIAVAFITALIFGVHPMHVESVAWISERKDVLYGFFFLLSLIYYWKYLQSGQKLNYILCFLFFVLSLLSKPAAIILPLVLFLLDFWKGRPINLKTSKDKIIFFLFAIVFAAITLKIQTSVAAAGVRVIPLWTRPFFATYGIMIYFLRFFIPYPLSSFHPFPPMNDLGLMVYLSPIFVLLLATFVWWQRKNRIIVFGFLFYVVNLLLVLQIISVGLTIVSERYTYIPYIGLSFAVFAWLDQRKGSFQKPVSWIAISTVILVFAFISFRHIPVWKDSGTLWSNVIRHYPGSPYARTNRANFLISLAQQPQNKPEADSLYKVALEDCNAALADDPQHALGYQNRINIFLILNRNREVLADADALVALQPQNSAGYLAKGIVYTRLNQPDSAMPNLNKCLSISPATELALNLRGRLLVNNYQRFSDALADFNKAIELNPSGDYYLSRSICYYRLGDLAHAKADANTALQKGASLGDSYRKLLNL